MKKAYAIICILLSFALICFLWGYHYLKNEYRPALRAQPLPSRDTVIPIDINDADMDELCSLPGIGETLALRILEYRSKIGGFSSMEQLLDIKGIGQQTYEEIRHFLIIGGKE